MTATLNFTELAQFLKENGLLIVPKDMVLESHADKIARLRHDLRKAKELTLKQIIDADLLPVKSKGGIKLWIEKGTIQTGEWRTRKRDGAIVIMAEALRRLGVVL